MNRQVELAVRNVRNCKETGREVFHMRVWKNQLGDVLNKIMDLGCDFTFVRNYSANQVDIEVIVKTTEEFREEE